MSLNKLLLRRKNVFNHHHRIITSSRNYLTSAVINTSIGDDNNKNNKNNHHHISNITNHNNNIRNTITQQQKRNYIAYKGNKCIGIVRENYNKWERRVALCPEHVEKLIRDENIRVLIQPSHNRIFTDQEYIDVGAEITMDLSDACLILGVKQPPNTTLLPDKNYMFFSHVIKGQLENMDLLDECLNKGIRLIDYETITDTGFRDGKRLVAFGRYAGIAGMTDVLQGVGQQLLTKGYSTPFINSPQTYMYSDLDALKNGVMELGKSISKYGLPAEVSPMTFTFTGTGNVARGAREIFELMPHEYVDPEELPQLHKFLKGRSAASKSLYATVIDDSSMVERIDGNNGAFDKQEYREHPELYKSNFAENILPYTSVLINGMYWDNRYPQLLTKESMKEAYMDKDKDIPLLAISDITCDIGGCIEFLHKATNIEDPFFSYDPISGKPTEGEIDGKGVVICGIDILPSELPREASKHFGDALVGFLPAIASSSGIKLDLETNEETGEVSLKKKSQASLNSDEMEDWDLPQELAGASITSGGKLCKDYRYITLLKNENLRALDQKEKEKKGVSSRNYTNKLPNCTIMVKGHLFDTNLINKLLDIVEIKGASFQITDCFMGSNKGVETLKTTAIIKIHASSPGILTKIVEDIYSLIEISKDADATVKTIKQSSNSSSGGVDVNGRVQVVSEDSKKVLLLGAGRVAAPLVEYLGRDPLVHQTVVSSIEEEAFIISERTEKATPVVMDVGSNSKAIDDLISKHDVVVSLLPWTMHIPIAEQCLDHGKDMVTASYVSPAMQSLDKAAKEKGIIMLNEVGLDPGMDHMSAMRIIDDIKERGGQIKSFKSLCGGLTAPEFINNPFMYKFSWSPKGVLIASGNSAQFIENGEVVKVEGESLLTVAKPFLEWPTLNLEYLPNRDSCIYEEIYGINGADTILRGTLRFQGWSDIMAGCRALGLYGETENLNANNWLEFWKNNYDGVGDKHDLYDKIIQDLESKGIHNPQKVFESLDWLGIFDSNLSMEKGKLTIDSFCKEMELKMALGDDERDLVVMHHEIIGLMSDGRMERHTSSFIAAGEESDSAMAKTVGVTCAIGVDMVLNHRDVFNKDGGVVIPITKELYTPMLDMLEKENLVFDDNMTYLR